MANIPSHISKTTITPRRPSVNAAAQTRQEMKALASDIREFMNAPLMMVVGDNIGEGESANALWRDLSSRLPPQLHNAAKGSVKDFCQALAAYYHDTITTDMLTVSPPPSHSSVDNFRTLIESMDRIANNHATPNNWRMLRMAWETTQLTYNYFDRKGTEENAIADRMQQEADDLLESTLMAWPVGKAKPKEIIRLDKKDTDELRTQASQHDAIAGILSWLDDPMDDYTTRATNISNIQQSSQRT